jgi:hypothetical protein
VRTTTWRSPWHGYLQIDRAAGTLFCRLLPLSSIQDAPRTKTDYLLQVMKEPEKLCPRITGMVACVGASVMPGPEFLTSEVDPNDISGLPSAAIHQRRQECFVRGYGTIISSASIVLVM